MASKLQCDDAGWPLVILTAPVQWGADSVVRYVDATTRMIERGGPFALVLDLTHGALPAADARQRIAAHRQWLYQRLGERLISENVVMRSRAHQESFLVLTGQGEVDPRLQFFVQLDLALGNAVSQLTQRGLAVTIQTPRSSGVVYKPPRKAYASEPELDLEPVATLRRFS